MNEQASSPKLFGRLWHLGLLAGDLAGVRLRANGQRGHDAQRRLVERLGALRGLPQKVGQLMALAGPGGPSLFAPLTESPGAPAQDGAVRLWDGALGGRWADRFRAIEPDGIAASLGQVHKATLIDGRGVAVKIRYPDSTANAEADLKALDWLSLPFGGLRRGFDVAAYQRALSDMLHQELDYGHEAQNLRKFAALARNCDAVIVPELIEDLCTDRVLTMTWLDGETFEAIRTWPEQDRHQVAAALLHLFLTSAFVWLFVHADPHPGNYRFTKDGARVRVGLLDFGSVVPISRAQAQALRRLVERSSTTEVGPVLADFLALGFNRDLLEPMAHLLPALVRVLFEPFLTDRPFRMSLWRVSERVGSLLGEFRWNFRFAGPASLIFLVRAYLGLIRYIDALGVDVNWSKVWRGALTQAVEHSGTVVAEQPASSDREVLSRHLRVAVWDEGQPRVNLTFKAALAESLSDLIPDDVAAKLLARGLDVRQIADEAVRCRFAPGELFQLREASKLVKVWLE
jgi:predicted unusual protein kinase regulating ubiquinone biosynthesis (AarF/ABC1/UbiB family)